MTERVMRPDWEKTRVLLVDPAIWPEYRKRSSDLLPGFPHLIDALASLGVDHHVLTKVDQPLDIWIRDWGLVEGCYFRFQPSYAKGSYTEGAIRKARSVLSVHAGVSARRLPLVLDGGNLIHNGKVAIVTEKVLWDNPQFTKMEIEAAILSLGFERVVFIPTEPEDVIGHADGIVRFVSPTQLLVNDYEGTPLRNYGRLLTRTLDRAKLGAEITPFPWYCTDERNGGIWSAEGCYINFILTARGIVVPAFGRDLDSRAVEILQSTSGLPIKAVLATLLARHGGVLNCVSMTT